MYYDRRPISPRTLLNLGWCVQVLTHLSRCGNRLLSHRQDGSLTSGRTSGRSAASARVRRSPTRKVRRRRAELRAASTRWTSSEALLFPFDFG